MTAGPGPVLFYDGDCGVCTRSVRFILERDRKGTLRFASLRGALAGALRSRHPGLEGVDSLLWVDPGTDGRPERVLRRSDAALAVVSYLGGPWRLLLGLAAVPRAWRDAGYDWVARNRFRLGGGAESCGAPSPGERERFLDPA
jgi:predicted DCC family thiol-disulfide oxidoreductase YuxK